MTDQILKPGDTYEKEIVFTSEDINTFARLTGDYNPIHFNADYASKTPFKKPVVHGMLAVSAFSGVMGMHFPGEGSIVLQRDINFIRPVFPGEKYVMQFKITAVDPSTHEGVIKTVLKNRKGQVCISGVSRIINARAFSGNSHFLV